MIDIVGIMKKSPIFDKRVLERTAILSLLTTFNVSNNNKRSIDIIGAGKRKGSIS
jgi:hypothetical protein